MAQARKIDNVEYGGINIIFAGDFAQLPPVTGSPLYDYRVLPTVHHTNSVKRQQAAIGKALWCRFTTVVILRENMRQKSQGLMDQRFRTALEHMRYKNCDDEDIELLYSRIVGFNEFSPALADLNFHNVSIITSWNAYRDQINLLGSDRFASETSQSLITFYSHDMWKSPSRESTDRSKRGKKKDRTRDPLRSSDNIPQDIQSVLWNLPHAATDNHPGKLNLCIGLPIMIKKNLATECGVTNGAEGIVVGWQDRRISGDKSVLQTVFVQLTSPAKDVQLEGLPLNVVPVTKQSLEIKCTLPNGRTLSIIREQAPIIPNFAMTDFNSQGRTRPFNVCDLQNCKSFQSLYTCLSRGSSYDGTAIIQGFDRGKIQGGISGMLRQ
ncbi:hypothetical protein PHLGIDRAFT_80054, partial [Phlebiopsis gigantea 11061_1 CR5-6]